MFVISSSILFCKHQLRKLLNLFIFVFCPVFCITLIFVSPIVRLRFGRIAGHRIGHMIANTEFHLRTKSLGIESEKTLPVCLDVYYTQSEVANRFAMELIRRRIFVISNTYVWRLLDGAQRRWPSSSIWIDLSSTGAWDFDVWKNTTAQLPILNEQDINRGNRFLNKIGLAEEDAFICFTVRDKAYLKNEFPTISEKNWTYHDYRDADINLSLQMAHWFADQGITVIRMGAKVACPLATEHPNIIDYAVNYRTEFLDIFLSARCTMFIGDTAGSFWMPLVFERPIAMANILPLTLPGRGSGTVYIPKKFKYLKTDEYIPYRTVVEMGGSDICISEGYERLGLKIEENSEDEILEMAKERYYRIDGSWKDTEEADELQRKYWSIFPADHSVLGTPARVSTYFLKKNRDLLV